MQLVERGVKVAIVGRELPEDLDSAGFASPWAVSRFMGHRQCSRIIRLISTGRKLVSLCRQQSRGRT